MPVNLLSDETGITYVKELLEDMRSRDPGLKKSPQKYRPRLNYIDDGSGDVCRIGIQQPFSRERTQFCSRRSRYSIRGEFSGLYFSLSRELCVPRGLNLPRHATAPFSVLEFEVSLDAVVDLCSPEIRRRLGVQIADLKRSRISEDRYAITQAIAHKMYQGHANGLIVPSMHDDGHHPDWANLVIYPANVLRQFIVQRQESKKQLKRAPHPNDNRMYLQLLFAQLMLIIERPFSWPIYVFRAL